jgi:hypothetical protein
MLNVKPMRSSLDVIDETGTWGVYVHGGPPNLSGGAFAQVACIVDKGP